MANAAQSTSASKLIDKRIRDLGDWRGETLARMRALIHEADPDVVEEWKWMGTPVWSHDGILCTGESYKQVVKLTFARGAALPDPKGLFNSSLDGNTRRAIDIPEGATVDARAFQALVRAAIAANQAKSKPRPAPAKPATAKATARKTPAAARSRAKTAGSSVKPKASRTPAAAKPGAKSKTTSSRATR